MPHSDLENFGFELVADDLKRLRRHQSLREDLEKVFKIINGAWVEHGICMDETRKIYQGDGLICYKHRVPITGSQLGPANGARLIYAIVEKKKFVPLLTFIAAEESKFPLRICKAIIKKRINLLP